MNQLRRPTSSPTSSLNVLKRSEFAFRSSSIRSRKRRGAQSGREHVVDDLGDGSSYSVSSSSAPRESSRSATCSTACRPGRALGRDALGLVATAADQVEEGRGELVRADARPLRDERRHERRVELGRRLLLVLAVVADLHLAAVEAVDAVDERHRRHEPEQREQEQRARKVVDRVVDLLAVVLGLLGRRDLLAHDPRGAVAARDAHPGGRRERGARNQRAQLDPLVRRDVDRAEDDDVPVDLDVAPHVDGAPTRAGSRRAPSASPGVARARTPTRRPRPKVHVDDVVVGDGEPAEAVVDMERALPDRAA